MSVTTIQSLSIHDICGSKPFNQPHNEHKADFTSVWQAAWFEQILDDEAMQTLSGVAESDKLQPQRLNAFDSFTHNPVTGYFYTLY